MAANGNHINGERRGLLASSEPNRPSYDQRHSQSSLTDVGIADLSGSVENLLSEASSKTTLISKKRGWGIVGSLGLLIFLQG
jgi:hypothetical protein